MIVVIDNYDSFVYNLVQYAGSLGRPCVVRRNDAISVAEVAGMLPELIIISPGPGRPADAGVSVPIVRQLAGRVPILGVCLGHQAIAEAFGARVGHARRPMHGKQSLVFHDASGIFSGLPSPLPVIRYHSLSVDPLTLPDDLFVTAVSDDAEVMGVRHRTLPVTGVQFHPESIFTDHGMRMIENALQLNPVDPPNRPRAGPAHASSTDPADWPAVAARSAAPRSVNNRHPDSRR